MKNLAWIEYFLYVEKNMQQKWFASFKMTINKNPFWNNIFNFFWDIFDIFVAIKMKFKLYTNDDQVISKLIFAETYTEFIKKGLLCIICIFDHSKIALFFFSCFYF